MKKYYDLLNLNLNASLEEAKIAYKREIKKFHPDLYPGDKHFAEIKTAQINEAYQLIVEDIEKKQEQARIEAREKLYGHIRTAQDVKKEELKKQQTPKEKPIKKKENKVKEFFSKVLDSQREQRIEEELKAQEELKRQEAIKEKEELERLERERQEILKAEQERQEAIRQEEERQEKQLFEEIKNDVKNSEEEMPDENSEDGIIYENKQPEPDDSYYEKSARKEFEYQNPQRKRSRRQREEVYTDSTEMVFDVYTNSPEDVKKSSINKRMKENGEKTLNLTIFILFTLAIILLIISLIV